MSDGRRARVRQLPRLGEGSPGSCEESFYIAHTGRRADLLASPRGGCGLSKEPKSVGDRLYVSVSSSWHVIPPNLSIHVLLSRHAPVCVLFARVIISSMVFLHILIATDVLDDQQVVS